VICEVLHDYGSPARQSFLELFCQEHRIAMVSVEQVYARRAELGATTALRAAG
jgi:3,4-dihydroxy-2-butanone 4-phosphate synthase